MNAELDVRMHDCIDQGDAGERYRRALTAAWQLDLQAPLRGEVIFVRRTSEQGTVHLLGRIFAVDPLWCFRLVRCEVDLTGEHIRC